MTTRSSPIQVLKAQADRMAAAIKMRKQDKCTFLLAMDDKMLRITMTGLLELPEKDLAKYILDKMQE